MNNRIVNTARAATRIVNTSARAKTLDGVTVGKALGAQPSGYKLGKDTGPFTLYQTPLESAMQVFNPAHPLQLSGDDHVD